MDTVEQDISAHTLFSRLGDFSVPRTLISADAGTEHSSLLFYCHIFPISIEIMGICVHILGYFLNYFSNFF